MNASPSSSTTSIIKATLSKDDREELIEEVLKQLSPIILDKIQELVMEAITSKCCS
jgi:hypothetical protein